MFFIQYKICKKLAVCGYNVKCGPPSALATEGGPHNVYNERSEWKEREGGNRPPISHTLGVSTNKQLSSFPLNKQSEHLLFSHISYMISADFKSSILSVSLSLSLIICIIIFYYHPYFFHFFCYINKTHFIIVKTFFITNPKCYWSIVLNTIKE